MLNAGAVFPLMSCFIVAPLLIALLLFVHVSNAGY